jgi:hypothetical protein
MSEKYSSPFDSKGPSPWEKKYSNPPWESSNDTNKKTSTTQDTSAFDDIKE